MDVKNTIVNCNMVRVVFNLRLKDYEIPAFRGAIIDTVGRHHVVFHNHLDEDKFHYKYPVIQYKRTKGQASIICIKEGVEELHHFFLKNKGSIRIGNSERELMVSNVELSRYGLHVSDELFHYKIHQWLPLHGDNFNKFMALDGLVERIHFLERILTGNILSMAKGLGWYIDKPVLVSITDLGSQSWCTLKKIKVLCFDLEFKTNVFLPYGIGLGKSSSIGFGTIEKATIKKLAI